MARGLKFWILEEEESYLACSKNKDADQMCIYYTADLWLCFYIKAKSQFSHNKAHICFCLLLKHAFSSVYLCVWLLKNNFLNKATKYTNSGELCS